MRRQLAESLVEAQRAVEEARRAEEEVRAQAEMLVAQSDDLRRSNEELEQFAYVASHDLQEPLRKVASFCQMLQRRYEGQLDERADQYIEFAVDGAKRMQQLINDLLAFSRVGRTTERLVPVDTGLAAQHALDALGAAAEEAQAEVEIGPLPTVRGDDALLTQVFQNLIGNAIKFRAPDRPAKVSDQRGPGGRVLAFPLRGQRDRDRRAVRRAGLRHLPAPARQGRVQRDRHRPVPVQEDRRVSRWADLAGHRTQRWPRQCRALDVAGLGGDDQPSPVGHGRKGVTPWSPT